MLEIKLLSSQKEKAIAGLKKKGIVDAKMLVEKAIALDNERKHTQQARDDTLAIAKQQAKAISHLMRQGKEADVAPLKQEATRLRERAKSLSEKVNALEVSLKQHLYQIPNLPHARVPIGKDASDNVIVLQEGARPPLFANALPHWKLIEKYDIIDFEKSNKITGAGFPFYKGKGARLQRALVNFFLDAAGKAGYTEVQPPIIVNEDSAYATGQLPDKEGQMYKVANHPYYLIPTAEIPITNRFRDTIIPQNQLPLRLVGYTPCFRREAGSWGADVRGLNRLHQFDKVEIVEIQTPEASYQAQEHMCAYVENLLRKLCLPFRKLRLCGGDISFKRCPLLRYGGVFCCPAEVARSELYQQF